MTTHVEPERSAESERSAERARTWLTQRLLLTATVTVALVIVATAAGVLGTVLGSSLPGPAAELRVAACFAMLAAAVSALWCARAAVAVLVVRANELRPCEITELRNIRHFHSVRAVLRIGTDAVPCSVEQVGDMVPGPALATRPAHWRVVVVHGDRPRLANQPWTRSFGSMWNAWLRAPETPDTRRRAVR